MTKIELNAEMQTPPPPKMEMSFVESTMCESGDNLQKYNIEQCSMTHAIHSGRRYWFSSHIVQSVAVSEYLAYDDVCWNEAKWQVAQRGILRL